MFPRLQLQYQFSLLRKLIEADSNDVPHIPKQRRSSYFGMILFVAGHLMKGCPTIGRRKDLKTFILRRTTAKTPAALYIHAMSLVATGQCATAMVYLNLAITRGHLPSRALLAHMVSGGRKGVPKDHRRAFLLVKEGTELGCRHCQGVLAMFYMWGHECVKADRSIALDMAQKSSDRGSRYGTVHSRQTLLGIRDVEVMDVQVCIMTPEPDSCLNSLPQRGYSYKYGDKGVEINLDNVLIYFIYSKL